MKLFLIIVASIVTAVLILTHPLAALIFVLACFICWSIIAAVVRDSRYRKKHKKAQAAEKYKNFKEKTFYGQ